jgi:TM2 domain-containing membrane protein YozV
MGDRPPIGTIPGIYSRRYRSTALVLAVLGGLFGVDRLYLGRIGSGLAKLMTLGGLGTWWLFDLLLHATHRTSDIDGLPLR